MDMGELIEDIKAFKTFNMGSYQKIREKYKFDTNYFTLKKTKYILSLQNL